MTVRVEVNPSLLGWALERSRRDKGDVPARLARLDEWLSGETQPTFKQLEIYAAWTHAPLGLLLLDEPPEEKLPVPDLRSGPDADHDHPSANLLDTIYLAEQRQEWFRGYALAQNHDPISFIGTASLENDVVTVAEQMRQAMRFEVSDRGVFTSWTEALRELINRAEDEGVLVMVSGVVGNNTSRVLDAMEFKGFALSDDLAPVVFINGTDYKAAQIFTLAHELAHLWLGQSAVSDWGLADREINEGVERWCNAVAGEFLVPIADLIQVFDREADLHEELGRLARRYRVSSLVVLRRTQDAGRVTWAQYIEAFARELEFVTERRTQASGNFYNTQPARASKRFTRALIGDTFEGRTLFMDAYRLLGVRSHGAFTELGQHLGVT